MFPDFVKFMDVQSYLYLQIMKRTAGFFAALLLLCISGGSLAAQDIIRLRNGEELKALITSISENEIRYNAIDSPDGSVLSVNMADVLSITYRNGTVEEINRISSGADSAGDFQNDGSCSAYDGYFRNADGLYAVSAENLRPGMSYEELKQIYRTDSWDGPMPGDPYFNQWRLNGLVPGLAQKTMGERARGTVFCSVEFGFCALLAAGTITIACSLDDLNVYMFDAGLIMTVAGGLGAFVTHLWSTVDAVQMMKIKNMYARDMRASGFDSGIELKWSPWVAPVSTGANAGYKTAAGLSISMKF